MSEVQKVTDATFETEVLKSTTPVLVDFFAEWCAPCRMIAPYVSKAAQSFEGKVKVVSLNVDDSPYTASKYQVMSIPTLIIFKDGKPVASMIGAVPYEVIASKIQEVLK